MSFEIYLSRFDPSGEQLPKHPNVLQELERVARDLTERAGENDAMSVATDGASFDIDLPGGTATVHPVFAEFPIQELDPLTLEVMFEIARAGDMVIIADGERAILTDPAQRDHLPEGWLGEDRVKECFSSQELRLLLEEWYAVQSGFRKQAISDWRQSSGLPSSAPGTRLESGVFLNLQRFDSSGEEVPKHANVLRQLERVAREVTERAGENDAVSLAPDGASLEIKLPGGTAKVRPTSAKFPIKELDPLTLWVVFEIARAGDMVILTEGGRHSAIVTDWAQHIPKDLMGERGVSDCKSPEDLKSKLKEWYAVQTGAISDWRQYPVEPEPVPGSRPGLPASFVYVEAQPKETATKQQKKVYKFYRDAYKAGRHDPKTGIMISEFWRLETPAGQAFYSYGYGGDKENWLALIREFAATEGRTLGCIEDFDTFVQDDGRRFPLSACTCVKVKD